MSVGRIVYRITWSLVRFFYPRIRPEGQLPEEPSIVVGNHSQMNGPITEQLYHPRPKTIWCAGQMMHWKEVPAYAFQDFWSGKPKWSLPFYRLLSYIITPLSVSVFNNADTLGVYRDSRIVGTFKETIRALQDGKDIIIFPETYRGYNQILCQFQEHYIDVARLYYKRTGVRVNFVPMYVCPKLKKVIYGTPTRFDPDNPMDAERQRINTYLMEEITRLALSQPEHIVVPYPNLSKKEYRSSRSDRPILPVEQNEVTEGAKKSNA